MEGSHGPIVALALFGWVPLTLLFFTMLPARRAILLSIVAGWLILPIASYEFRGLPNYTKMTAVTVGTMMGAVLFDMQSFLKLRPKLIDVPVGVLCLAPMGASLTNGLGLYDGISGVFEQFCTWGIPYLLGRTYFTDAVAAWELATAILLAGVAYVPLCLFEMRMSPQLHNMVYGYHQHDFIQTVRGGGYRPMVFLQHGLAVGLLMSGASLAGIWLWRAGGLRRIVGAPMSLVALGVVGTAVLCRSLGALACLVGVLGAFTAARILRTSLPVVVLAALPVVYVSVRATGSWSGEPLVAVVQSVWPKRAESLQTRIDSEDLLAAKAMEQPVLGWGGFGRSRVVNEEGHDIAITDGLWIIVFGEMGLVGLSGLLGVLLLPALRGTRLYPAFRATGAGAACVVLTGVALMYSLDCLLNAMINPIYHLAIGALAGIAQARPAAPVVAARAPGGLL